MGFATINCGPDIEGGNTTYSRKNDVKNNELKMFTKLKSLSGPVKETDSDLPALDIKNSPNNNFGKLLVQISSQITDDELSNLKLLTLANKQIRKLDIDKLKHPGDFLSLLYRRHYYDETNTDFLAEILKDVGRVDLHRLLQNRFETHLKETVNKLDTEGDVVDSPCSSLEGYMSVDASLEREEEPMQSSQNSICDDEKLHILQKAPE